MNSVVTDFLRGGWSLLVWCNGGSWGPSTPKVVLEKAAEETYGTI